MEFCGRCHLPSRLRSRLLSPKEENLLSAEDIASVQSIFGSWLQEQTGHSVDWSISPDQPYCLHALSMLSSALHDCDISLFGALLQGVPTGFKQDIPLSGCFAPSGRAVEEDSLSIALENWQGAEADPLLLEELVQVEVDSGWLRCIDSLEDARKIWPNVAVGKLNIVHSAGRKPRLVVDSSVCGTNSACLIPERSALPTLQSIQCAWPLRGRHEPVAAWSIDVKSAHKSIRVRESEQGLLGIRVGPKLFFYKVCPFGAAFSAFWFARLGAFFVRTLHRLIYISHFLALYVDDFLGYQSVHSKKELLNCNLGDKDIWLRISAHKDISCYECLGQIALVWSWKPDFPLPSAFTLLPLSAKLQVGLHMFAYLCYQHASNTKAEAETLRKRAHFWQKLASLLSSIPRRHLLLMLGDFNTPLDATCLDIHGPCVPEAKHSAPADVPDFTALLKAHQLLALNTHRKDSVGTYKPYLGEDSFTQIDFIFTRGCTADATAKQAWTLKHFPLQVELFGGLLSVSKLLIQGLLDSILDSACFEWERFLGLCELRTTFGTLLIEFCTDPQSSFVTAGSDYSVFVLPVTLEVGGTSHETVERLMSAMSASLNSQAQDGLESFFWRVLRLGRMWRDSDVILFLGDEASLATHQWEIRFEFCQKLFNTLFEWECESRCNVWFERVPSASNPADDPSRLTFRCNPDFVQGLTPGDASPADSAQYDLKIGIALKWSTATADM
ncbi:hypothetical protein AK812_SmicGene3653 [Symbiodinium microadriaticum]|uniref:Reverse transcriptase domain-containing protein n=1 Tax=Symbiodinium microadriaticum TaxID=2951 RepID=A0A1Q9EYH3_SYMMI|nr:hypothetical protein AK812_SmicGene3653 [Symbiodinium microadriaticum]